MGSWSEEAATTPGTVSGAIPPFLGVAAEQTSISRELLSQVKAVSNQSTPYQPIVLLPLEVMVKPLELRFTYHFEGDRPTNRLDKV